jgi:hypothetical protein
MELHNTINSFEKKNKSVGPTIIYQNNNTIQIVHWTAYNLTDTNEPVELFTVNNPFRWFMLDRAILTTQITPT